jgi:HAMP domain-containing protein
MKPYIVKLLELAHASHERAKDFRRQADISAEQRQRELEQAADKVDAEALDHLREAARQVRAQEVDATSGADKLDAARDKADGWLPEGA